MHKQGAFNYKNQNIHAYVSIDAQRGRGVRSEKLSHKNVTKHKRGPPRFYDKPKDPPWISNYCASMYVFHKSKVIIKEYYHC
jgi:hypothetical protein